MHCLDDCDKTCGIKRTEPTNGWSLKSDSLGWYVYHLDTVLSGPWTLHYQAEADREAMDALVCIKCGAPFVPCTIFTCPHDPS